MKKKQILEKQKNEYEKVEPEDSIHFSGDSPLLKPSQDELGYSDFANNISKAIMKMTPRDGIVMALNGPWGSGKSTVLNFINYYLQQYPEEEKPKIIRFNPWWFSGREDLTRMLIGQIGASLGKKDWSRIKNLFANFSELISNIPIKGTEIGKFISNKLREQPDIQGLKEKIGELLLEKNQKILIFIDDLDRLSPEEICSFFGTIKSVANFPNMIYFLAFDNQVVTSSLDKVFSPSGKDYLDKIIQVPYILPLPEKQSLNKLLFDRLDRILAINPDTILDSLYWPKIFIKGLSPLIKTPRDVNRLINALNGTYPSVSGEVNPVDFIAIEAVRIFYPLLYEEIRFNGDQLVGVQTYPYANEANRERQKVFGDNLISLVPIVLQDSAKDLLSLLFPRLAAVFHNRSYSPEYLSEWRKNLRICHEELFPLYFRFSLPQDSISANQIRTLMDSTHGQDSFSELLLQLTTQHYKDGTSRLSHALDRIEDYTKDIPIEDISPIIHSFMDIGDKLLLPEDEGNGIFDFRSNIHRIARVIFQLSKRLDLESRFNIYKDSISKGSSIRMPEYEVAILGQEHGKHGEKNPEPEPDRSVNAEQLSQLEEIMLIKIRNYSHKEQFLNTPDLLTLLNFWEEISQTGEVKTWVEKETSNDSGLLLFLKRIASTLSSYTVGEVVEQKHFRLDPEWIKQYLDPESTTLRLNKIVEDRKFKEDDLIAAKQYIKEYQARKDGKHSKIDR